MTPPAASPRHSRHAILASIAALVIGAAGLYPHLRWSLETGDPAWFFNSYDEGYYGWLSLHGLSFARALSDVVMHGLYYVAGADAQRAMILADFLLPAGVVLAACYLTRPLYATASAMVAGAMVIVVSAECLALRSTSIPHAAWMPWLQEHVVPWGGGPAGVFQLGNQTSTFWVFRTPEPQISWIVTYVSLGLALRLMLSSSRKFRHWFLVACLVAGGGYLFCSLALGAALVLTAVLALRAQPACARWLAASGLLAIVTCLGLSLLFAHQAGGDSLVFPSRQPVVMLSAAWGLVATGAASFRAARRGAATAADWFAIGLGLTPLLLANQQLATGRMIYLLNFENFGLAPLSAIACLIAFRPEPALDAGGNGSVLARWLALVASALIASGATVIVWRSQLRSFDQYRETNRIAQSYARTLDALPTVTPPVVCEDFFETDILALLVGRRPNFLLSRDTIFTTPIARLTQVSSLPANGRAPRLALFHYLALTGTTPDDLARRLHAVADPTDPNWQDRLMLGAFLYNHSDFWSPLTHGRDSKLPWIAAQRDRVVEEYRAFLAEPSTIPGGLLFIMRADRAEPDFLSARHAELLPLHPTTPYPMRVYRIGPDAPAATEQGSGPSPQAHAKPRSP